ncbi:MAG TPA: hypothetical protein VNE59_08495 [Burkholderiales bacterium]|nr:hypothetical protein [Burkholderiales bacterium]
MHCELVVPALVPAEALRGAVAGLRLPALELLLARGRATSEERRSTERWLADAFGLDEDELPAGALSVLGEGSEPGAELWLRADPVHLRLMRDELRLIPSAGFAVSRAEAEALCAALNAHFGGELVFYPLHPERWSVKLRAEVAGLEAQAPLEIAGENVSAHLPAGPGAKHWQAVLNEVQMLLHASPVNEARDERGEPAVNSVWLWGAGRRPGMLEAPWQSLSADDPLALGLARAAGMRHRPMPACAGDWLERLSGDGRHLALLDALRAAHALGDAEAFRARLQTLEERWFAPLLAALKAGAVGMVTIQVPDAEEALCIETVRGDLRRFWRRPRALGDCA